MCTKINLLVPWCICSYFVIIKKCLKRLKLNCQHILLHGNGVREPLIERQLQDHTEWRIKHEIERQILNYLFILLKTCSFGLLSGNTHIRAVFLSVKDHEQLDVCHGKVNRNVSKLFAGPLLSQITDLEVSTKHTHPVLTDDLQ